MNKECISVVIDVHEKKISKDYTDYHITLPAKVYNIMKYKSKIKLKIGNLERNVKCYPNRSENVLELSEDFIKEAGLCEGNTINLTIKNNKICLGPVIGIFISNGQVKKANAQNPKFRWTETIKANRDAKTLLYYFSIKDVDFALKKIIGTYFNDKSDQWERKYFPYPDILYDRGGGVLKSQKIISNYIRKELEQDPNLIKINPEYFFDKWEVHKRFVKYEEMSPYLPLTILYTKPDDLLYMFNKSKVLYIKDCQGNNGIGVARVRKISDKKYELSHFLKKTFKYDLNSFSELIETIEEVFKDKKMIIQTAVEILKINNRSIDMRATVQRDGEGKLQVSAFPVRLGKEECPITSTRSGSSVYIFDYFFEKFFEFSKEDIERFKDKIIDFLIISFKCVEDVYGKFGEVGIDFAIDKNWRIWFIECNAKPGKDTVYLSYDDDTVRRVFLNPLEYGKYLWKIS